MFTSHSGGIKTDLYNIARGAPFEMQDVRKEYIDQQIDSIRQRMLINQMPLLGDLTSADEKDIQLRIKAIQSLLTWKETKSNEIRLGYQEKLRRVTFECENLEKKCERLEQRITEMDK